MAQTYTKEKIDQLLQGAGKQLYRHDLQININQGTTYNYMPCYFTIVSDRSTTYDEESLKTYLTNVFAIYESNGVVGIPGQVKYEGSTILIPKKAILYLDGNYLKVVLHGTSLTPNITYDSTSGTVSITYTELQLLETKISRFGNDRVIKFTP